MPKMRGFKAELWTDEKFVELDPLARLLFMGMWTYACDNGHLDDKPKQIKMRVLPTDEVDAAGLIDQMVTMGMVVRKDGVLTVPKLREHQRIDDRYFTWCVECRSDSIPEKFREKHAAATADARQSHGVNTSGTRSEPTGHTTGTHDEGRKEGRKEGEGDGESAAASGTAQPSTKRATSLPADFRPNDKHVEIAHELNVDLRVEWPKFCDHHTARGSTFKDWNAALRTWIRNAPKFSNVRHLPPADDTSWMRRRP